MRLLGHEFKPMSRSDWDGFAGADEGSLICSCSDGTVLIWSPVSNTVSEMLDQDDMINNPTGLRQRDWSSMNIA